MIGHAMRTDYHICRHACMHACMHTFRVKAEGEAMTPSMYKHAKSAHIHTNGYAHEHQNLEFSEGDAIVKEGQMSKQLYHITHGHVNVLSSKGAVLYEMGPGDAVCVCIHAWCVHEMGQGPRVRDMNKHTYIPCRSDAFSSSQSVQVSARLLLLVD
jgi:hypothetical protein